MTCEEKKTDRGKFEILFSHDLCWYHLKNYADLT